MAEKTIGMGDLYFCEMMGKVFRSYFALGYDMKAFVGGYLSMNPANSDWSWVEELPRRGDDAGYDADAAEWIGFAYTALVIRTGKTGAAMLRIAPFEWMLRAYAKLSCVVEDRAVEILMGMLTTRGALKTS